MSVLPIRHMLSLYALSHARTNELKPPSRRQSASSCTAVTDPSLVPPCALLCRTGEEGGEGGSSPAKLKNGREDAMRRATPRNVETARTA